MSSITPKTFVSLFPTYRPQGCNFGLTTLILKSGPSSSPDNDVHLNLQLMMGAPTTLNLKIQASLHFSSLDIYSACITLHGEMVLEQSRKSLAPDLGVFCLINLNVGQLENSFLILSDSFSSQCLSL